MPNKTIRPLGLVGSYPLGSYNSCPWCLQANGSARVRLGATDVIASVKVKTLFLCIYADL